MRICLLACAALTLLGLISCSDQDPAPTLQPAMSGPADAPSQRPAGANLPRLLSLGAAACVPCKMMEPIRGNRSELP